MENSNVTIGSNIYPCNGNPSQDPAFMAVVEDYPLLKEFADKALFASRSLLTGKQREIIKTDMRCVYAKNDPCWGYVEGKGIRSKCIVAECPRIYRCNPEFKPEERKQWSPDPREMAVYGDPKKQRRYYLVDLVSDREKELYIADPGITGPVYPFPEDEPPKVEKPKRHMVIIGYEITRFNDYEDEQQSPIYGYVEDEEEQHSFFVYKTSNAYSSSRQIIREPVKETLPTRQPVKVVKEPASKQKPEPAKVTETVKIDTKDLQKCETEVKGRISSTIGITELSLEQIKILGKGNGLLCVFSNPAEKAYASSMLIASEIAHSVEMTSDDPVILCTWDELSESNNKRTVLVSENLLENGCTEQNYAAWELLRNEAKLVSLTISGREYYSVSCSGADRWACGNLYGVTHICLIPGDLTLNSEITNGIYKSTLVRDDREKGYTLVDARDAAPIGKASELMLTMLNALQDEDEISSLPEYIQGIWLHVTNGNVSIQGIGHLKFAEY